MLEIKGSDNTIEAIEFWSRLETARHPMGERVREKITPPNQLSVYLLYISTITLAANAAAYRGNHTVSVIFGRRLNGRGRGGGSTHDIACRTYV